MRVRLLAIVLIATAVGCGGGQPPCNEGVLCAVPQGTAYFSIADAASGAAVQDATFVLVSSYGRGPASSIRVSSIPDGPSAGPCDCYRLTLPSGPSQLLVQASGFSEAQVFVDLGHSDPPPAPGVCNACEGTPPGSGMLTRVALRKN